MVLGKLDLGQSGCNSFEVKVLKIKKSAELLFSLHRIKISERVEDCFKS